jgi:hypothetical protein
MLEVLIATAILAVVMAMAYAILASTSKTSTDGMLTANLEDRGRYALDRLKTEFYDARFNDTANTGLLGIHDNHTQVHFQVALQSTGGGNVDYGYVGGKLNVDPTTKKAIYTDLVGTPKYNWIGCTCVIRFEPELVIMENGATDLGLVQPTTNDDSGPQDWHTNPYNNGGQVAPGAAIPKIRIKGDLNKDGDKTDVFVKGKIWKYVFAPGPGWPTITTAWAAKAMNVKDALTTERISDDVVLAVDPTTKTYEADWDAPTTDPVPGKDWLFRYLASEQNPPSTYGRTDTTCLTNFPGPNSVAMMVVIWHATEDDSGKGTYNFRKAWERIPFRLSKLTGS